MTFVLFQAMNIKKQTLKSCYKQIKSNVDLYDLYKIQSTENIKLCISMSKVSNY